MSIYYVSPSGNDANSGTSWETAKLTITSALGVAGTNEIWVAAGTYTERINLTNAQLYGGFTGTETSLDQRNYATNQTIIDAQSNGRVVNVPQSVRPSGRLDGFILQNGYVSGTTPQGAGIILTGSPTIANNIIRSCVAKGTSVSGYAIYLYQCSSIFINNLIVNNAGHGTGVGGAIQMFRGVPKFINNTVANNTATATTLFGTAAFRTANQGKPSFYNNIVVNNSGAGFLCTTTYNHFPLENNNVYGNTSQYTDLNAGTGSISVDPAFVDPSTGDYSLQSISLCIAAGNAGNVPDSINTDLADNPRLYNGEVDIGSYQYQGQRACVEPVIDPPAGSTPIEVSLTTTTPNSNITYTLDGSAPTSTSTPYSTPFQVSSPATVKARTFAEGLAESAVSSVTYVPVETLFVSPSGNDSNNGNSWSEAFLTIGAALNAVQYGTQIWAAAGTYSETNLTLKNNVHLLGGFAGTETAVNQRNWKANSTVIDGGGSGTLITAPENNGSNTRVDGFTLQNAHRAIYCEKETSPLIANNVITGNSQTSSAVGGTLNQAAVYITNANPVLINNLITSNHFSINSAGGQIAGGGIFVNGGTPIVSNNTIVSNSLANAQTIGLGASGGGIYAKNCMLKLTNNIIEGNSLSGPLERGGGIFVTGGNVDFSFNCVYGNSPSDYSGCSAGSNSISEDPLFEDPTSGNFQLGTNSPARDSGDNNAPGIQSGYVTVDLDHNPRIVDSTGEEPPTIDMGAYEAQ